MKPEFHLLESNAPLPQDGWTFSIQLFPVQLFETKKRYVGALGFKATYVEPNKPYDSEDSLKDDPDIELNLTMVASIGFEHRFSKEVEKKFFVTTFPGIILPYIRAYVTSLISVGGHGGIVMPLIATNSFFDAFNKDFRIDIQTEKSEAESETK